VPFRVLAIDSLDTDLAWAAVEMDARRTPVALLVPPRVVETGGAEPGPLVAALARREHGSGAPAPGEGPLPAATMSRLAALGIALKAVADALVTHANGYICRESFAVADRPQSFYMIGSMGLAPAIALGLALTRPTRHTVVFDGDGNLLMNLGVLAMIAAQRPARLVHLVFDNEVYGSTGNQASLSRAVRLDRLAASAGFASAAAVTEPWALESALQSALATPGPHFVLVKVTPEEADVPRIPYEPAVLRDRFRAAVRGD
jgi:thiamine pyrophosphate-dependent acetolactate synthase large subunit-like protein